MGTLKTIDSENKAKTGFYFEDGEKKLELFLFSSSKQVDLSSLTNLTTIETGSFKNVKNVELIHLPATVSEIKEKAFENCQELKTVILNDNNDSENKSEEQTDGKNNDTANQSNLLKNETVIIQSDAFKDCDSLDSVYLKSKKIEIQKDAFSGCTNLRAIILDSEDITLASNVFSSSDLVIYAKKNTSKATDVESYCRKNNIAYEELK